MENSCEKLAALADKYIPGGAHTYSRGKDQYPSNAPKILQKGSGAYVWDADGKKYLDYGMALRSVTLGYGNDRVLKAAVDAAGEGNNLTRPSITEVLAAQDFCETIPGCDMVKFGKTGSSVVTGAVKLARAYTARKLIVRCKNHPFFSFDDWFIGDTAVSRGVPSEIQELTKNFEFNNLSSLETVLNENAGHVACVVMEPSTHIEPAPGFLQSVIDLAHKHGAVVIFDEMITGFRWDLKGASHYYGVRPDLFTFGKGMANGFSVAAIAGKREVMQLGNIEGPHERVFLMSTTHGAEMSSLAAFRETLKIYKESNVTSHLWNFGKKLASGVNAISKEEGLQDYFKIDGVAVNPIYVCRDRTGQVSLPFHTLFHQEMLNNGVLIPCLAFSFSHGNTELEITLEAARKSLKVYKSALEEGYEKYLKGHVIKPVFRKFN